MSFKKLPLLLILGFLVSLVAFFKLDILQKIERRNLTVPLVSSEKPKEINSQGRTVIKYPTDYTIVLLGDSMTEKLGNADELRAYLNKYYPDKTFEVLNYGYGSTNILSVQERLEKTTFHSRDFRPILDIAFDLILIESFGHNPLSEYPLEEGLKKQTAALDQAVKAVTKLNPKAKIAFVATLAPNKEKYGEGQVDLSLEKRAQWALERNAYIENHIKYATDHDIPLINIYKESMSGASGGNLDYFDKKDYIHPSPDGVYFISKEIAKYIFESRILN